MKKSPNYFQKSRLLSLFTGLSFLPFIAFGYQIEGKILLPENADWAPVIYLSQINSFDDLNAVSEDFIINKVPIRADGYFILSGENIPEGDRIYRLHICQKGDPIATIMIGGEEENHCHFLMNKNSKLTFEASDILFSNFQISENQSIDDLKKWLVFRKKPPKVNSKINRAFRQKEFENALSNFADTTENITLGLLSLHYLDFESDLSDRPEFYQNLFFKWKDTNQQSPYFLEFEQKLRLHGIIKASSSLNFSFWILGFSLLCGVLFFLIKKRQSTKDNLPTDKIAQLSNQERRVFDLLKTGKTNKEISNELNIGLSTVKSHIHKIYSKLGIKSRKQVRVMPIKERE